MYAQSKAAINSDDNEICAGTFLAGKDKPGGGLGAGVASAKRSFVASCFRPTEFAGDGGERPGGRGNGTHSDNARGATLGEGGKSPGGGANMGEGGERPGGGENDARCDAAGGAAASVATEARAEGVGGSFQTVLPVMPFTK